MGILKSENPFSSFRMFSHLHFYLFTLSFLCKTVICKMLTKMLIYSLKIWELNICSC